MYDDGFSYGFDIDSMCEEADYDCNDCPNADNCPIFGEDEYW